MVNSLIYLIILPGFLFTALIGLISTWVDRKVTARVQWRVGPPWYQPFADIAKLLGKELTIPEGSSRIMFIASPLLGLAAVTLVSTMLWVLNINTYGGFVGDLIVVVYLLTLPSLSVILGGSASRNPYSALGASREMKLILAYELPFIIAVLTVVAHAGSLLIGNIVTHQAAHGMIVSSPSGIIALIVSILVVQAKLGFVPFDVAEAEQEIMGGALLEYSGALLAIYRLTKAMLLFVLPVFLITLFLGGISFMTLPGIVYFIIKYVIILTVIILIKNTNPRIRVDQAIRFFWGPVTVLAMIGLVLAMLGW